MKRLLLLPLVAAVVVVVVIGIIPGPDCAAAAADAKGDAVAAVAAEVEALRQMAQPGSGITAVEQKASAKVVAVGVAAVPGLLALLRDDDEDVRALAAYTLTDMPRLDEQHLEALIEYQRRDDGWIPHAIAQIGTPRAITFLVEELVRDRETHTQITGAIRFLGAKAVPELLRQIYTEDPRWDSRLEDVMLLVFDEMGAEADAALDPLLKIATDDAAPLPRRLHAMQAVGAFKLAGRRALPTLQKLMQWQTAGAGTGPGTDNGAIRAAARQAIISIGSTEGAPLLAQALHEAPDTDRRRHVLSSIARLRENGRSAGPVVASFLRDADWDVRVAAARTLGRIVHTGAVADLIPLLAHEEDWRQVYCAARSLGALRSRQAVPALTRTALDHWYPPVRQAAQAAIQAVNNASAPGGKAAPGKEASAADDDDVNDNSVYGYEQAGAHLETLDSPDADYLRLPLDPTQHIPLTLLIQGRQGPPIHEDVRAVPVPGGHLVGTNNGEWGGNLSLIDSKGRAQVILNWNTEAVYQMRSGHVAVTGLAHMGFNDGTLYKVSQDSAGTWTAKKWRVLPGAPVFSRLLQDGRLLVACHSGGIVMVTPEGRMTSHTRAEVLRPDAPPREPRDAGF